MKGSGKNKKMPKFGASTVWLIVFFLAASICLFYALKVVKGMDIFKVKEVIAEGADIGLFEHLKGRSIFSLDLNRERDRILRWRPDYKRVRLIRIFPNQIYVDFLKKEPLAYVKLYRNFMLDDNLTLFEGCDPLEYADIPLISGLEDRIRRVEPNRRYNLAELVLAVNIIKEAKANQSLDNMSIKRIDVDPLANTTIFVSFKLPLAEYARYSGATAFEALEVRIGQGNIRRKMAILSGVVSQAKADLGNIKYVDLRFKEPVLKLKNAN